ncbi:MAG: hypothetical protein BGN83_11095 [Rhizobium sp. 63-7]|nr:MAG: hypothetical protein BGN83_11095 [Rhizobium sp. 63-7]
MDTGLHQQTAKIYQFPLRGRRRFDDVRAALMSDLEKFEMAPAVVDTCWYHDEAVRDAGQDTSDGAKR